MADRILRHLLAAASSMFEHQVTEGDNFFDVGGDSLLAVELGLRLETELGLDVDPMLLMEAADFGAVAAGLSEENSAAMGTAPAL
jgi:acyl carrier protein